MGLSAKRVERHIREWEKKLAASYPTYRSRWPAHLFHHAPIENVASILRRGALLSREDSDDERRLDVADPEVLKLRARAHKFARLYFRPRTPTQFHIEGIRKANEYYKSSVHSPTLVMLVFDARSVLAADDVRFSRGNMQSAYSPDGDTEEFFDTIDFQKVYHEGGTGGDQSIITARCAEVLAPSPLELEDNLRLILCRSQAERAFLLDRLRTDASFWSQQIVVSEDIRAFERRYTFAQKISIDDRGVLVGIAPRWDGRDVSVQVEVDTLKGKRVLEYGPSPLRPFPPNQKKLWRIKGDIPAGTFRVRVWLETCLAFEGVLLNEDVPF
jgi:hypothetical protein